MSGVSDTIAAMATAPGRGGIAVLRVSGARALPLLRALFRPAADPDFSFIPRHMHYGLALDSQGLPLDQVLAVFMPAPHSFTGEDTGEIHCHGGLAVSAALLEAALAAGARHAEAGEFTRRAFLNGRLDLSQAEAVAELVAANSLEGARLARARLEGRLGAEIAALRASLDALRTQITLDVDFAEEESELLPRPEFTRTIDQAAQSIRSLLAAYERARFWREGALAVLAGRVNAGKSSLLNALLGRERAIVSASPGTTRDYIEEEINLSGLPLRLIDTAGLRQSGDIIENEGMRRAGDLADRADLVLLVCDMERMLAKDAQGQMENEATDLDVEEEFLRKHPQLLAEGRLILVMNKADKAQACVRADSDRSSDLAPDMAGGLASDMAGGLALNMARQLLAGALENGREGGKYEGADLPCPVFAVSASTGFLLDELAGGIRRRLTGEAQNAANGAQNEREGGDLAPNMRQSELLRQSLADLEALALALKAGHPPDILSVHLDAAALRLDEISGLSSSEELLNAIFSSFCIGK